MAGRYTGSYLDRSNGWRTVATLAEIGRASLVGRIPVSQLGLCQDDDNKAACLTGENRNMIGSYQRVSDFS